ncbi:acetylornithine deacetylase/succinyl-diaminopimelate desuccinylase-like protein [Kibdelosporangium banguiense]|uniref:Acetylornithine deacetylase/succinyl-diaminopimelate desuccinylase-like protein n=1 Tax=Kibdelosporangium banguiense TaxID=1365924 RepID=A0ABS4TDA3_9PSEU|nr:M20/M25/M40 family metallo-hydrolase [Kibdelosporangium banguiense]MBP2321954.1 acetylornithine deacetylase/succinyl-diaminopimelate desuccinylase-like protein [Kibdelosporangium banguiense]
MEHNALNSTVTRLWDTEILPSLSDLVAIPALSPVFDPAWAQNGHLDDAAAHVSKWVTDRNLPGTTVETVRLDGRTPLVLIDVPATPGAEDAGTVVLYGHLDKQPPVGGWADGLGPWTPVIRDGRLYGRGAADDGYSGYAAIAAIEGVRAAGGSHARCVILLETSEESGSPDLAPYLMHLKDRLGEVTLVVCLDSGGSDYSRLWITTSLRGMVSTDVTVRVLDSGAHSGMASGIVPSSFRIMRTLLDRIENSTTGEVLVPEMHVEIPSHRVEEARVSAAASAGKIASIWPFAAGTRPVSDDDLDLLLNNSWRPTLSVIGASGLPQPLDAGNVLRPFTTLSLSFRLPPTADSAACLESLRKALTTDVPYGAQVEITRSDTADGWDAPALAPWLKTAVDKVSTTVFDAPWGTVGLGGSIPFMGLLAETYPEAQFLVTGACGADSNIHVPNEWLHLGQAARVTASVGHVLHAHATR